MELGEVKQMNLVSIRSITFLYCRRRRRRRSLSFGCCRENVVRASGKRISEISPQRAAFPLLAVQTFLAHHANMSSEIGRESILTQTVDFTFDEF